MTSKVKVCIPIYNNENTIKETLNSISKLKYDNFKVEVFENNSSDKSLDEVSKFVDKFDNFIVTTSCTTVSAEENFTKCISAAEGEYTALFHSDDIYSENILDEQVKVFKQYPDIGAVFTHASLIDENGTSLGERFIPGELLNSEVTILSYEQLLSLVLKYGNFVTCPSALIKSSILKDEIKVWNGEDYKSSADLDVWLRIAKKRNVAFIAKPLINYRISSASFSFNLSKIRTHRHDLFLVLDKYVNESNQGICKYDKLHLEFLNFKDYSFRLYNSMKLNKRSEVSKEKYSILKFIPLLFKSKFHLKFFILSLGIQIYSFLRFW